LNLKCLFYVKYVYSNDKALADDKWCHGKLAYYISALQMTGTDPRDFYGHNLLVILQQHLRNSKDAFLENKFALSLVVIVLCNNKEGVDNDFIEILTANPGEYKYGVGLYAYIVHDILRNHEPLIKTL